MTQRNLLLCGLHYRPQCSCGKVMFLHLSVILFTDVRGRGVCMADGVHGRGACVVGCMHGMGHVWLGWHAWQGHLWWGVCVAGGMHGRGACMATGAMCGGGHVCLERWPLQQTVCILLECILVYLIFRINCQAICLTWKGIVTTQQRSAGR